MNIFTTLLVQPLTNGLFLFYRLLGENLGVAIVVFSIALIFLMKPLTKPYMDSMKKVKELEPQINKLKAKYGTDKLGFSKAQADLYKEKKINVGAGCLPYLLQIFILFALFNVFTTALSANGDVVTKLNALLYEPLRISEGASLNTKFLYLDISRPDVFRIPGIPFPIPGVVLILATIAQFISVKITTPYLKEEQKIAKKTKTETDDMQVTMQKSMSMTLPLMTLFFGVSFPSGLALYWLIFSAVNAWQQVSSSGWGGLTPLMKRLNLLKS